MKLSDIDIDILLQALRQERSEWLDIPRVENRRPTEAEKATVCVLYALDRALGKATSAQEGREEANRRAEIIRSQPFDNTVLDGLAKAIGNGESEDQPFDKTVLDGLAKAIGNGAFGGTPPP